MTIKDIYLNKFSVFNDIRIEFCKGINVIIGDNGVGKTHLLKFLYALYESANERFKKPHIFKDVPQKQDENQMWFYERTAFIHDCFRPYSPSMLLQIQDTRYTFNGFGISCTDKEYSQGIKRIKLGNIKITTTNEITHDLFASILDDVVFCGSYLNSSHTNTSVFIPANEMLTHATLYNMNEKYGNNMPYDNTCLNIIELARRWKLKETPTIARDIVKKLESIMEGTVIVKDDGSFWMQKQNGVLIPFTNEAEGLKRFGLLWQLLLNESIIPDSILFWDEPENSINPKNIPALVESLLEIQRHGVQVFVATHSYDFARYFEILKKTDNRVLFHSLFKEIDKKVMYTQADSYIKLNPNSIEEAGDKMYKDIIQKTLDESIDANDI